MRYTRSRDEAQDLLHDGFIKIFESIGHLKNPLALENWMQQIMARICINYVSRHQVVQYADIDSMEAYLATEENEEEELENNVSMEQIVTAIQSLPPKYRLVFNMHEVEEIDFETIGKMLKLSEPNIRSILMRARIALRKKLKNRITTI